jgi:NitT/TauT family transport system substrate-binding protein
MKLKQRIFLLLGGTLLATVACLLMMPRVHEANAAGPFVVRYASVGGTTDAGLYIADELGFFKDVGIDFRYQRLESAAVLLAAIATEQIDVAGISVTPGLFSAVQQGVHLRIVGDKESILPHFSATQLVARKELADDDVGTVLQRLKSKTVAVSGKTSVSYFLFSYLAKKHGFSISDFKIVELSYANAIAAFSNGAIDAAVELEPFLSRAIATGMVKAVSDFVEIVPPVGASIVPIVYSEKFIANRIAAEKFMVAYMRAVRVYNDAFLKGIDKEKIIDLVARRTNSNLQTIRDSNPVGFEPNQEVNAAFLDEAQHFFLEQHFVTALIDVNKIIDPSFADAAVRVLGKYK